MLASSEPRVREHQPGATLAVFLLDELFAGVELPEFVTLVPAEAAFERTGSA
jgi:hypothetical protein